MKFNLNEAKNTIRLENYRYISQLFKVITAAPWRLKVYAAVKHSFHILGPTNVEHHDRPHSTKLNGNGRNPNRVPKGVPGRILLTPMVASVAIKSIGFT